MRPIRTLIACFVAAVATWSAVAAQDVLIPIPEPPIRLELNIPAFRLDVLRDTAHIRSFDVAVGTPRYPTPRGEFAISEITWNPWWFPPPSEWAREDTVTPPGPGNAMGRVKMQLAPNYLIHGTPLEQSIGSAASHGCVRMRNDDVVALARLLQDSSGVSMPDSAVAALLRTRKTRVVILPIPLPVRVVYNTADVRTDSLLLYPDIYRLLTSRRENALGALMAAGLDSAAVDGERLSDLLAAARTSAVRVPLDSLRQRSAPVVSMPGKSRAH